MRVSRALFPVLVINKIHACGEDTPGAAVVTGEGKSDFMCFFAVQTIKYQSGHNLDMPKIRLGLAV